MNGRRTVLFLSYYGPEEAASGIRAGRLARAASRGGERVVFLHGAAKQERELWHDGVELLSFERPFSPTPSSPTHSDFRPRGLARRAVAIATRSVLQPDRFVMAGRVFYTAATAEIHRLRESGDDVTAIPSVPPWSTALIASRLATRARVRIVADVQDLWAANPEARWPLFGRRLALRWQRRLLDHTRGFLFVNDDISRRYEDLAGVRTKPRAIAPIGFENPLPASMHVPAREQLRIGYFGSIYGARSFDKLLDGIAMLPSSLPAPALHWYGDLFGDHPLRGRFDEYVARGLLVHHPPLPYREARALMPSFHLLLVVPSPRYPEELTTKFYDYLDAGRPILALAPTGTLLHRLVESARVGVVVPPHEPATISQTIEEILTRGLTVYPQPAILESHRFPALTQALCGVLDRTSSLV